MSDDPYFGHGGVFTADPVTGARTLVSQTVEPEPEETPSGEQGGQSSPGSGQ